MIFSKIRGLICSQRFMMTRRLAAFDFDHTVIDVNSDIYIDRILIEKSSSSSNEDNNTSKTTTKRLRYPSEIDAHRVWTHRMDAVFAYMHANGVTRDELTTCVRSIRIESSMCETIRRLKSLGFELIVVSDANSVFIDEILRANELAECFTRVYTNQAQFDESGRLRVRPFEDDFGAIVGREGCACPNVCSANMCKGSILKFHLSKMRENEGLRDEKQPLVVYVGDGTNDYCPGFCLTRPRDLYFVRSGFSLHTRMQNDETLRQRLPVDVTEWRTGEDILNVLKNSEI